MASMIFGGAGWVGACVVAGTFLTIFVISCVVFSTMFVRYRAIEHGRRVRALAAPADQSIERLKCRYAAGDIDDVEFEHRLEALLRH